MRERGARVESDREKMEEKKKQEMDVSCTPDSP